MVFPNRGAILGLDAFAGHTRPHDFRQTVNVDRVDAHALFNRHAHVVGPRLGAKNTDAQRSGCGVNALALVLVGNRQHVAGRDHDDVGLKVLNQLHLPLGLTAAKRHDGEAELFGAIVRAQAAGEQAIAVADVHHIARFGAAGPDAARHHGGPGVDVARRVAHHGGLAGGAAGGMDARALLPWHGKHAKRVTVAQIELGGERKLGQIAQAFAVIGVHARCVELGAVHRRVGIGVVQRGPQALELQRTQLVNAGLFNRL